MQERWKQRFENFERAFGRLLEAEEYLRSEPVNHIFQMAVIQAFEFSFELGWKTVKDYLSYQGTDAKFTREAIKEGFSRGIIFDGQTWIEMMEARNLTSHAYSQEIADKTLLNIKNNYINALKQVYEYFKEKI